MSKMKGERETNAIPGYREHMQSILFYFGDQEKQSITGEQVSLWKGLDFKTR